MIDRKEYIVEKCINKSVLDIGCIAHHSEREKSGLWLHKHIGRVAKELVGLDYEKREVDKLNKKGYSIKYGDATNFNINKKFDVIVCGEIIEHLDDFKGFFKSISRHLERNGIIIITTPNVFRIRNILRMIFVGKVVPNREHTCWFDEYTLSQLIIKNGFNIIYKYYYLSDKTDNLKHYFERFMGVINKRFCPQMLFVIAEPRKLTKSRDWTLR